MLLVLRPYIEQAFLWKACIGAFRTPENFGKNLLHVQFCHGKKCQCERVGARCEILPGNMRLLLCSYVSQHSQSRASKQSWQPSSDQKCDKCLPSCCYRM